MRALMMLTVLLALSVISYGQTGKEQPKKLVPLEQKELNLNYFGKDSSALKQVDKFKTVPNFLEQLADAKKRSGEGEKQQSTLDNSMPVMVPDTTVQFKILVVQPDTSIHYHMQIKE